MNSIELAEIEGRFSRLSHDEQLLVIEHLIHRMRTGSWVTRVVDDELAEMADDPDIQRELRSINAEFACTEMDGLEDD